MICFGLILIIVCQIFCVLFGYFDEIYGKYKSLIGNYFRALSKHTQNSPLTTFTIDKLWQNKKKRFRRTIEFGIWKR